MSYNISSWRTKRLENLTLPLPAFYRSTRQDWHPEIGEPEDAEVGAVVLACGCEQEIRGVLEAEPGQPLDLACHRPALQENLLAVARHHPIQFRVTEFEMMDGEGSGTFYQWILRPALEESRGTLEAVLIWEGGDSISRLTVEDGAVTEEEVE